MAALGVPPTAVTKGAYCRRVAGGSALDFRAVWAFTRPPVGKAEHFRKLTEEEAVIIARERWGVDGSGAALRQDSTPVPLRTVDNKKRGSEETLVRGRHDANRQRAGDGGHDSRQLARSHSEVEFIARLEHRLAALEAASERIQVTEAATAEATARNRETAEATAAALTQLQDRTQELVAAQAADRVAVRTAGEASVAAVATALERLQGMMVEQARNQQAAAAEQARNHLQHPMN